MPETCVGRLERDRDAAGDVPAAVRRVGSITVVVGAVLSILSVIGAPAVSTLPAPSLLQKAISCVPSVPKEKAPL